MPAVIDRLAAYLAHQLNQPEEGTWLDAGALYAHLLDVLAGRYAGPLLYHPVYEWRMSAEEAAARYFDATLGRKLWLSGRSPHSIAHRLFLALVQRLPDPGWRTASLQRTHEPPAAAAHAMISATAAHALHQRLRRLGRQISTGNAAQPIRERDGALWLVAGHVQLELPEEMSLWDAIATIPPRLLPLEAGEPFNRFCGLVIDALRTANRPIQEVLGLGHGLCPFDWLDVLSTSQVRSLRRFLAELPGERGFPHTPEPALRELWQTRPVAGFRAFDDFWRSDIGQALRQPQQQAYTGTLEDAVVTQAAGDSVEEHVDILDAEAWAEALQARVAAGAMSAIEARMLVRLYAGEGYGDLEADPACREALATYAGAQAWGEQLLARLSV